MLLGELMDGIGAGWWAGDRCAPIHRPADGQLNDPIASIRVCDITEDSRTVMPGSMFVARKGAKFDGHDFVLAAAKAEACCIFSDQPALAAAKLAAEPQLAQRCVVMGLLPASPNQPQRSLPKTLAQIAERFYSSPSSKMPVIGVTGTKGKTTTTWLIHDMLSRRDRDKRPRKSGLIGTVVIDDGVEVAPAMLTTPPALELSRTLRRMREAGCGACAMEVSSHALDQHRATGITYKVAVFTNLGHDHLDYHGTMEHYAAAKAALFSLVPPDGCAIVNGQDPWSRRMVQEALCPVIRCGVVKDLPSASQFDLAAIFTQQGDLTGTHITIVQADRVIPMRLPLIGEHNVMNALQALASIMQLGVTLDEGITLLSHVRCPPGRMERVESRSAASAPASLPAVYVDYAHTPESLEAVLTLARNVVTANNRSHRDAPATPYASRSTAHQGRVICVFGCGGDRDRAKRPRMAAIAQEICSATGELPPGLVIITSDNPRSEDPDAIASEITAGLQPPHTGSPQVIVELDRAAAILRAIDAGTSADLVLIAGKGHEDYQIVRDGTTGPDGKPNTIKRPFDDRLVASHALEAKCNAPLNTTITPPTRPDGPA